MASPQCGETRPIKPITPPFQDAIPSSTPGPGHLVVLPVSVLVDEREAFRREVLGVVEP